MTLNVLSWNIWIDSHFELVKEFLANCHADVIGLQEVRADDPDRRTIEFLEKLGYQHVFAPVAKIWGGKVWNDGPAIFTKSGIISSQKFILSEEDSRAGVQADIKLGEKTVHIFSTHLIHTHQQASKIQEEQVNTLLKLIPQENSILMGDFNATPESKTIESVRARLVDVDTNDLPTWSVYPEGCITCMPQKIDTKLDYIFTTRDITSRDYKVESSKGSDHLPISVVLEV